MGREDMAAKRIGGVVERGVALVRPVAPAASNDQHDLFARLADNRHPWGHILPQLLGLKVRHHFLEDLGGALLHRP